MSRVLVTGGAGFIGNNLVRRLHSEGYNVDVVDNMQSGDLNKLVGLPFRVIPADLIGIYTAKIEQQFDSDTVVVFEGDFTHPLVLSRVRTGFYDYVFHLAADPRVEYSVENPVLTTENNVLKTLKLVKACSGSTRRFIFSSSSAVYGDTNYLPTEENTPKNPQSPYGLQKLQVEQYLPMFYDHYGVESVSLRYFNVYGPGHLGQGAYATAIAAWCNAMSNQQSLRSDGDGNQSRDLIYVDDVVEANILAATSDIDTSLSSKQPINICTGERITNNRILGKLTKYFGPLDINHAPERPGDVKHTQGDPRLAEAMLGFKASVSFDEGLHKTLKWWELINE